MTGHFTTEIGRMRCEEMVNRGLRYQAIEAAKRRNEDRTSKQTSPSVRRHAVRRVPIMAGLATMMLLALSSGAMASPAGAGGQAGDGAVPLGTPGFQLQEVPAVGAEWILGAAVIVAILSLAFALRSDRTDFLRA